MINDLSCFYNGVRLFFCGVFILILAFKGSAQNLSSASLPIGATSQTVKHAVVLRYSYFHYVPYRSSSHSQNQAFRVAQPKFALPSANPTRTMAFNSRSTDVILSNVGVLLGGILGGVNYRQPKSSYNDKYSLRVGTKP